jgi:hypothetical protein
MVSMVSRDRGELSAIISGWGRRTPVSRLSEDRFDMVDMVDPVEVMLEVDRFLPWPRECEPVLPPVDALDRPGGLTRSVLIWRWNLVPVAASDSAGMSSLTCTVWACWRRLSRREKRRAQWHWNGRSPVCFLGGS